MPSENSWVKRQGCLQKNQDLKKYFSFPPLLRKHYALHKAQDTACIIMLLIVSTSQPGEWGVLFPFLSTVLISLPASVLTSMELQAYGEILIPFNYTWLGLNYLVKVLPVHEITTSLSLDLLFFFSLLTPQGWRDYCFFFLLCSPPLKFLTCSVYSLPLVYVHICHTVLQSYKSQVKFTHTLLLQRFYSPLKPFLKHYYLNVFVGFSVLIHCCHKNFYIRPT